MRALLIEDEPEMARLLARTLADEGLTVDRAASLEEARAALAIAEYRLLVLDRRLEDGDGLELLRTMSPRPGRPAVLVLSALHAAEERVHGLDAGADDYLGKPFDTDELSARIRAALRRGGSAAETPPVICGRLAYCAASREFTVGGEPLHLRRREAKLLGTLIQRVRRVVQRATLINEVYAFEEEPSSNTLDAHISRLRKRLDDVDAGVVIHPVRGVGYILDAR
ncbi:response regulator transcription factor [Brevundimonas diminuta]|uniref:Two-component system response regulator n=1 Tax=Brevundimonas diminuta TaxID=293 RepID=A0A1Z3LVL1_BREDI|nr:response regulator transcription factor [Brevundimonas diminuta]ASD26211.1 two-component system response regulator [Brevundimonas diminuta]